MFLPLPRGLQPYVVQRTGQFASPSGRDWITLSRIVYDSLLQPTKLWFRLYLSSNVGVQTFISPKYLRLGKLLLHQLPNIAQAHQERNFVF